MMFKHEQNAAIKIFSQLYVGIRAAPADGSAPLAFATPYESTAQGLKRQDTVLNWLGGEYERVIENGSWVWENGQVKTVKATRDIRILENTLRSGFRITDDVKRVYWGGGNVVFRIQDPYGFELEIESGNLMALIQTVGITAGGEIPVQCIWGRDGSKNILITEGSDEYQGSVKAAESIVKPKVLGQAQKHIGSTYRLSDGTFGQYLGKMYLISSSESSNGQGPTFRVQGTIRDASIDTTVRSTCIERVLRQKFDKFDQFEAVLQGTESDVPLSGRYVKLYKTAPLTERLDTVELTAEEASAIANQGLITRASSTNHFYSTRDESLVVQKPSSASFYFKNLTEAEFKEERLSIQEKLERQQSYGRGTVLSIEPMLRHSDHLIRVQTDGSTAMYGRAVNRRVYDTDFTIAGPCTIVSGPSLNTDTMVRFLKPDEYGHGSQYAGSTSPAVLVLPMFDTVDEVLEYLDNEYKACNLFTIGIQVL